MDAAPKRSHALGIIAVERQPFARSRPQNGVSSKTSTATAAAISRKPETSLFQLQFAAAYTGSEEHPYLERDKTPLRDSSREEGDRCSSFLKEWPEEGQTVGPKELREAQVKGDAERCREFRLRLRMRLQSLSISFQKIDYL